MAPPSTPTPPSPLRWRALWLVVILVAAGLAAAQGSAAAAPATCFGREVTIVAIPGVPTVGTPGADVIMGTPGNDRINGRGGDDRICSGAGSDRVLGGAGADRISLGAGDDLGMGGSGRDLVAGNAGDDVIRGGPGNDRLIGGAGDDLILGQAGNDVMNGTDGGDRCRTGSGRDRIARCTVERTGSAGAVAGLEARMLDHVNALRAGVGVPALTPMAAMADVARRWSATLPSSFGHNPNVGSQIPSGWRKWAENIGYRIDSSSSDTESLDAVFWGLSQSPGHYANMTDPELTHIGVGIHVVGDGVYVTQVFARY